MDEKQKSVPAECKERISFDGFYSFVHYEPGFPDGTPAVSSTQAPSRHPEHSA